MIVRRLTSTFVLSLAMMAAARSETMWQRGEYAADVLWTVLCLALCWVFLVLWRNDRARPP